MKNVIITGASGFVGSWLVRELSNNGYKVYAVLRSVKKSINFNENVEIIKCDMEHIYDLDKFISERNIDAFFHLAWDGSGGEKRSDYNIQLNNVKYSCDAAHVAKKIGVKHFFSVGTISENIVDNIFDYQHTSSNMIYAIMKKTSRYTLDVLCKMLGLKFTWLQFSNVYGPNNTTGNLISYALDSVIKDRVAKFSEGNQPYDFIYVKDLVYAIRLILDKDVENPFYFIGSGSEKILKDYLLVLSKLFGPDRIGIGFRKEDGIIFKKEWFDISRLQYDTGFQPKTNFVVGIKETYEWINLKRRKEE